MDTISSAEFRKTYAKLRKSVVVTVNGHGIGVWTPTVEVDPRTVIAPFKSEAHTPERKAEIAERHSGERFNTVPFTGPIPKVRR